MKCQFCSNPATVHLTEILDGQKKELHLCQSCAESQQLIKHQEINLPAILQTLIGQHLGQRALTRAVGAHNRMHLAGIYHQVHPSQDLVAVDYCVQVFDFEQTHRFIRHSPPD